MKIARLSLLTIALIIEIFLQQSISSIPPALALRDLNETWQTQNGSLPIDSNSTAYLPDPSNCDSPQTIQMDTFFFANSSEKELNADAIKGPLASNFSQGQNLTHNAYMLKEGNVSDCGNASSTTITKSLPDQNQAVAHDHTDNLQVMVAHVNEDAPLYEIASMHVVAKDKGDVLLLNEEQLKGTTPASASNPIHIPDPSSNVKDTVQVMMINDDDVVLVDAEQLNAATAPATRIGAHTAAQSSAAKESVQVMEVGKDGVVLINAEQLGGPTPPPGSPSIHTAAQSSVARESVQVMEVSKGDVLWINEEQLAGSTPPPSDNSIHTAAQSSVARESVEVMVIDEADVVLVNAEQLRRSTPPPIDTSIHTAGRSSVARESVQVMVISEDGEVLVNEEQLGASTPPPGDSDIHTASQSSVARDYSFHGSPPPHLQHDDNQDNQLLRL